MALVLAVLAGVAASLQAFVLGRLATNLGSDVVATTMNQVVALVVLLAVAVAAGAPPRAVRRIRAGGRVRWWHPFAGACGALTILLITTAVSKVGVALLTVALVCGQTIGSLVIDRLALSPAGRGYLTWPRVIGAALALAAVGIAAFGSEGDLHLGLLALAVLGGAAFGLQGAAMGHVSRATGEPLLAALVNMAVGASVILVIWLVIGSDGVEGSAPAQQWAIPGLCAVFAVFTIAKVVAHLGVLRLMLGLVAGQSLAGLALDVIAPVSGQAVTIQTIVGVVLTLVAVAVSGMGGHGMHRAEDRPHDVERPALAGRSR